MPAVTVSIASPAVVTWANHGFSAGKAIRFTTTGALPTGLTPFTWYYVIATGLAQDVFQISASYGGAAITTTGTQSGAHTGTAATLSVFLPDPAPSPGTTINYELKLKRAPFGDGYSQDSRDGINHQRRVVELKWNTLNVDMAAALESFFVGLGGDIPFLYALSDDITRQWTCVTYNRTRGAPNQFAATLREDFNRY